MRPTLPPLVTVLLACAFPLGCAAPRPGGTPADGGVKITYEDVPLDDLRWETSDLQLQVLEQRLPPVLVRFESADPRDWEAGKAAIQADPVLLRAVTPNIETGDPAQQAALLWCTDRGARGARAREQLAFLGRAYAAAAGFRHRDPERWTEARRQLQALGPRGIDSAAIGILLQMRPLDLPVSTLRRWQRELVALGPDALRVIRIAITRMNWLWMERVLPVLGDLGEPAADMLVEFLDHENEAVVRNALRALAIAPHPKAVPRLRRFLAPDQSWVAQSYALAALGRTPGPEAAAAILEACDRDDPSVARFAAGALADHLDTRGDPAAARALLKLWRRTGDDWQEARAAAREALQQVTGLRRGSEADYERWLHERTR